METVLNILSKFEGTLNTEFGTYITEIQTWITGVIALAFLLYLVFSVALPMMQGKEFDISKFITMLVLFGMFKMYPTLIKNVDNFCKIPGEMVMNDVKAEAAQVMSSIKNTNPKPASQEEISLSDVPGALVGAVVNSIQQVPILIYSLILTMGLYILFAIVVLIKLASVVAANIIIVLGSIPFALSFLPGFSGGIPHLVKTLLAVRLWPFVGGLIYKVILSTGLVTELINQISKVNDMMLDPKTIQSWDYDFSPLIIMIAGMFLLAMTPKFVDMAINVSTSAGAGGLMGASSIIGGISSMITSGSSTALQSALGFGSGGQQQTQNQILGEINQGIQNLGSLMANTAGGGSMTPNGGNGQGADKSTMANPSNIDTNNQGNDKSTII